MLNTDFRDGYGHRSTFSTSNCSAWEGELTNQSDTGASGFVFTDLGGATWNNEDYDSDTPFLEWPGPARQPDSA